MTRRTLTENDMEAIVRVSNCIEAIRQGNRDGGTFGRLSLAHDALLKRLGLKRGDAYHVGVAFHDHEHD